MDLAIENKNKVIECVGPAHFTVFNKKMKGQTKLRLDLLKRMGVDTLFIDNEEWYEWKAQNLAQTKILEFVNKKP